MLFTAFVSALVDGREVSATYLDSSKVRCPDVTVALKRQSRVAKPHCPEAHQRQGCGFVYSFTKKVERYSEVKLLPP